MRVERGPESEELGGGDDDMGRWCGEDGLDGRKLKGWDGCWRGCG